MKKTPSLFFCILFCSCICFGQQATRVFDNFDRSDLTISVPVPPSRLNKKKATEKRSVKGVKTQVADQGKPPIKKTSISENTSFEELAFGSVKMKVGNSLKGFTTGDPQIDSYIVEFSNRYNIDPLLIYAQMHQESSFKRFAVSPKGASGLMQLMPATARRFGVTNIFDPKQNIEAGVKYMRWLLDTFNQDLVLALAGYNAGEGAVMRYGWQVPPYSETREYVRRILLRYSIIQDPNITRSLTRRIPQNQIKKLIQKEQPNPLTFFELTPFVINEGGRQRLVNRY
jgi:hypothetical protein